jgi:hypothetical protein
MYMYSISRRDEHRSCDGRERGTLACGRGVGGVPIPTRDIHCGALHVYFKYFVIEPKKTGARSAVKTTSKVEKSMCAKFFWENAQCACVNRNKCRTGL